MRYADEGFGRTMDDWHSAEQRRHDAAEAKARGCLCYERSSICEQCRAEARARVEVKRALRRALPAALRGYVR